MVWNNVSPASNVWRHFAYLALKIFAGGSQVSNMKIHYPTIIHIIYKAAIYGGKTAIPASATDLESLAAGHFAVEGLSVSTLRPS